MITVINNKKAAFTIKTPQNQKVRVQFEGDYLKQNNLKQYDLNVLCKVGSKNKLLIHSRKRNKYLVQLCSNKLQFSDASDEEGNINLIHDGEEYKVMLLSQYAKKNNITRQMAQYVIRQKEDIKAFQLVRSANMSIYFVCN